MIKRRYLLAGLVLGALAVVRRDRRCPHPPAAVRPEGVRSGASVRPLDPGRVLHDLVSGLQSAAAVPDHARAESEVSEDRVFRDRLRSPQGPGARVPRAQAEHADRVQGQERDRALDRRHQPRLDRSAWSRSRSSKRAPRAWPRRRWHSSRASCRRCRPACCRCCRSCSARALSEHRAGPLALAGGLALSFVVIGLIVATIGFAIGLDAGVFRMVAGDPADRRRRRAAGAAAAGAVRARRRPGRKLDRAALRRLLDRRVSAASSRSGSCSARCGARASGRRWAPPRCWPRRARTSARSPSPCWRSGIGAAPAAGAARTSSRARR